MDFSQIAGINPFVITAIMAWEIAWKGYALWKAARNNQIYWYLPLLLVNTIGILPIVYIFFFRKDRKIKETKK